MKDHIKFASNWQRYKHSVRVFHGSFAETVSPFLFLLYPAGRRGTVSLPPAPNSPPPQSGCIAKRSNETPTETPTAT